MDGGQARADPLPRCRPDADLWVHLSSDLRQGQSCDDHRCSRPASGLPARKLCSERFEIFPADQSAPPEPNGWKCARSNKFEELGLTYPQGSSSLSSR